METYYEYLRKRIQDYADSGMDFDKIIFYLPDMFKLLTDLLDQDVVDKNSRRLINSALGYFIAPDDVLPEDAYGPHGYMDDIYLCADVLTDMFKLFPDLMTKLWTNDDELPKVLDRVLYTSGKFLDDKDLKGRVLAYSGLAKEDL